MEPGMSLVFCEGAAGAGAGAVERSNVPVVPFGAGIVAAWWVIEGNAFSGWALGVLAAVLGYAVGSVAALSFLSDLVVRAKEAAAFPHAHK